jgi:hypothetical protein
LRQFDHRVCLQFDEKRAYAEWHRNRIVWKKSDDQVGLRATLTDALRTYRHRPGSTPLDLGEYALDIRLVLGDGTDHEVEDVPLVVVDYAK